MSTTFEHTTDPIAAHALWSNLVNVDGTSPYTPGSLHLRVHQGPSGRSRTADLAGISMWAADEKIPTTFLASSGHQGHEFSTLVGCGWHDPILRTETVNGLLDATAALYRLWSRAVALGAPSCMLAIESLSDMTNGPLNRVVADDTNAAWLDAVRLSGTSSVAETVDKLRRLTGLDFEFHQNGLPESLPATCIVAGVSPRKSHREPNLHTVQGSSRFVQIANTVVEYHSVDVDPAGPSAIAKVTVLKHRSRGTGGEATITVTRPISGGCWTGPTGK